MSDSVQQHLQGFVHKRHLVQAKPMTFGQYAQLKNDNTISKIAPHTPGYLVAYVNVGSGESLDFTRVTWVPTEKFDADFDAYSSDADQFKADLDLARSWLAELTLDIDAAELFGGINAVMYKQSDVLTELVYIIEHRSGIDHGAKTILGIHEKDIVEVVELNQPVLNLYRAYKMSGAEARELGLYALITGDGWLVINGEKEEGVDVEWFSDLEFSTYFGINGQLSFADALKYASINYGRAGFVYMTRASSDDEAHVKYDYDRDDHQPLLTDAMRSEPWLPCQEDFFADDWSVCIVPNITGELNPRSLEPEGV